MACHSSFLALVVLLAWTAAAAAYPRYWASQAPSCTALPLKGYGCHKAPIVDRNTVITVYEYETVKPTASVCAGKLYYIQATFTDNSARLAYMTVSAGTMITRTAANNRCKGTMSFDRSLSTTTVPARSVHTVAVAPKDVFWTVQVASASGTCTPYLTAVASIPILC